MTLPTAEALRAAALGLRSVRTPAAAKSHVYEMVDPTAAGRSFAHPKGKRVKGKARSRPDDEKFDVLSVSARRVKHGQTEYLVQWRGYSEADDTVRAFPGHLSSLSVLHSRSSF